MKNPERLYIAVFCVVCFTAILQIIIVIGGRGTDTKLKDAIKRIEILEANNGKNRNEH